jgi:peptidyl-Lys metalloendopeptidase
MPDSQATKKIDGVVCTLSAPPTLARDAAAQITIVITNQSTHDIRILKRNTPLEDFLADYLRVDRTHEGKTVRVPYQGPVAKRAVPAASEYVHLAPQKSISRTFALSPAYDVSATGEYRVRWSGELLDATFDRATLTPDNPIAAQIACNAAQFTRR